MGKTGKGCLIVGAIIVIAIVAAIAGGSDSGAPGESPADTTETDDELDATVRFQDTPAGIQVMNESDEDYTDCEVSLNQGLIRGGWERTVDLIPANEWLGLPFPTFTKSDGSRFDPQETAVKSVFVNCQTPSGERFASFEPK